MDFREMNLAVFERRPIPHVFFQPRFEPYVAWQRRFGRLPEEVAELDLPAIYDYVGASMRTVDYYTGQPSPIEYSFAPEVKVSRRREGDLSRTLYETPHGSLEAVDKWSVDEVWRTIQWPARSADDLPALRWLLQRRAPRFHLDRYLAGKDYIGRRGEGHFWVPKSPYFALAQQWLGHADFMYAMADRPDEMAELMGTIDETYDPLYEQLCACPDVRILNFGENVAMAWLSPRYYERHVEPWYHKRAGQLRRAGIFSHVHIDGHFRGLLPYLKDMPFDGLEALTPTPQGDVTLEEIAEHIGGKILLDGIPAVLFMEHHPFEQLQRCAERVVELFHPRLVLGVSDELPEGGGAEAFRRLKWVADWCRGR
jgi:hypothetical protein